MGNYQSLQPNQDNNSLLITETLIEEFENQIKIVDHSVLGLAKAVDVMNSFLQQLKENKSQDSAQERRIYAVCTEDEMEILYTINECISSCKIVAVQSIGSFLNYIKRKGRVHIKSTDVGEMTSAIDVYCQFQPTTNAQEECVIDFFKKRIKNLKLEIEHLKEFDTLQKKTIENYRFREETYLQEKEVFKHSMEDSQKLLDAMQKELKRAQIKQNGVDVASQTNIESNDPSLQFKIDTQTSQVFVQNEIMITQMENKNLSNAEQFSSSSKSVVDNDTDIKSKYVDVSKSSKDSVERNNTQQKDRYDTDLTTTTRLSQENTLHTIESSEIEIHTSVNDYEQNSTIRCSDEDICAEVMDKIIEMVSYKVSVDEALKGLQVEIGNLKKEIQNKEMELKQRQETIQNLTNRRHVLVQVYSNFKSRGLQPLSDGLFRQLESIMESRNIHLKTIKCSNKNEITDTVPLLISVDHISSLGKNKTLEGAFEGFDSCTRTNKNWAVVVFHHKKDEELQREVDGYKKIKTKTFACGLFHVGYKDRMLSTSDFNEQTHEEIIKFLLENLPN